MKRILNLATLGISGSIIGSGGNIFGSKTKKKRKAAEAAAATPSTKGPRVTPLGAAPASRPVAGSTILGGLSNRLGG